MILKNEIPISEKLMLQRKTSSDPIDGIGAG
jgi:hypothetical protein